MKQTWSLSKFTWCPKLPDFTLIGWPDDFQVVLLHAEEINSEETTGPKFIKLEYSLKLRIKCNHCALFEFENDLKFYNLQARSGSKFL